MDSLIEIQDVTKIYTRGPNQVQVLDHIDLSVEEGWFVVLMGPSGSGKSTLLNLVAGVDEPTSGSVVVGGLDLSSMKESKITSWRTRNIGYVFQFYNLMPVLTAYENIELPLLLLSLSKKQRHDHVMAALEAVGLEDRSHHYPRQLSGGQEQRVALARAIVADTRVLLADEPTGNLDAESEIEIMELLRRLNSEFNKTILMVTHDASAAAYGHQVLKLEKGRLVAAEKEAV